jgi:hypothetical protein
MISEPTTVGISNSGLSVLRALETSGVFHRVLDGYRFAVGLGIAHGGFEAGDFSRVTVFNVGTLDPDRTLFVAVGALRSMADEPVYRSLERYAEWGARELGRLHSGGDIEFGELLREAEDLLRV